MAIGQPQPRATSNWVSQPDQRPGFVETAGDLAICRGPTSTPRPQISLTRGSAATDGLSVATFSVLSMTELGELSGRETLDFLRESFDDQVAAEVRQLHALCHLADIHRGLDEHRVIAGVAGLAEDEIHRRERSVRVGADGSAPVAEWLALEIGPLLGITPLAAGLMLADVLNLRDRHPRLWTAVQAGRVRFWQAKQITRRCASAGLSLDAAKSVDDQLADAVGYLPWGRVLNLLDGLVVAADPVLAARREDEARRSRFVRRARTVTDGVATVIARVGLGDALRFEAMVNRVADVLAENGDADDHDARCARAFGLLATPARALALLQSAAGATKPAAGTCADDDRAACSEPHGCAGYLCGTITVKPRQLLPRATLMVHVSEESIVSGRGVARIPGVGPVSVERLRELLADSRVTVKPVFQPGEVAAVDCYEIPAPMRAAVLLRDSVEVFPFSSRRSEGLDLDHTRPFDHGPGAPPGQTRTDNLGPLSRRVHRAKTHGDWRVEQWSPGVFEWTSPYGYHYLVGPFGTIAMHRLIAQLVPLSDDGIDEYDEVA